MKHASEPDAACPDDSAWTPFVMSVPMLVVAEGTNAVHSDQPVKLMVDKPKPVKKTVKIATDKPEVGSAAIFAKLYNDVGGSTKKRKASGVQFKHLLS